MKTILYCFILLFVNTQLFGQAEKKGIPISVGYYSPYLIQPGIKIGASIDIREWGLKNPEKNGTITKSKSLFVSPQIGLFTQPKDHTSLILNADIGYKWEKIYSTFSIGLGYLAEFEIISISLNFGDGEINEKNKERRDYFVSTINYEFGSRIFSDIGWYSKLSYGRKFSSTIENATIFIIELGINFTLNRN